MHMRAASASGLVPVGLWLCLQASPAAAYIDPGTGSALFYVISGIIVSIYFAARSLYYRAVDLVFRMRHRDQRCDVAIHCEDPRYEITFLPVVRSWSGRASGPRSSRCTSAMRRSRRCRTA